MKHATLDGQLVTAGPDTPDRARRQAEAGAREGMSAAVQSTVDR
jgi:hypothetical protein